MQPEVMTRDLDAPRVYPNPDVLGISPDLVPNLLALEYWPSDILHKKCKDVANFHEDLQQLIYDMAYTMYRKNGIGLAAPQVGKLLNLIVVEMNMAIVPLINPRVIETDNSHTYEFLEGCLSVPGYYEKRKRPQRVIIEYQNSYGLDIKRELQGLAAFVVQHEIDHLNGSVFVDELSSLKKERVKKKMKKFRKNGG